MDRTAYAALLARARRLSRSADEAADLLQDTLLAAVRQGRVDARVDGAWLAGVMRRQAALRARTDLRRRRRDAQAAVPAPTAFESGLATPEPAGRDFLAALSPASRRMAVLVLHGLDPQEIGWLLGLGPVALRQRASRLRLALERLDPALRAQAAQAARQGPVRRADLAFGPLRRTLRAALRGPSIGTHDPDGYLLVVRAGHA